MAPFGGEESGREVSAATMSLANLRADRTSSYLMTEIWSRRVSLVPASAGCRAIPVTGALEA